MTADDNKPETSSLQEAAATVPAAAEQTPADGPQADAPSYTDPTATIRAELEDALKKVAELQDQFLRARADAENTRRRAIEDEAKARKYAIESFADALLPVKDSLEAALNTPNQTPEALREGVEATLRQLSSAFERHKLTEIMPAVGDRLDPHRHQAIGAVPSDHEPNTVVSVLQKGYAIAERTLRPALVMVAQPKSDAAA
jgi:molecular chaperone GrpE